MSSITFYFLVAIQYGSYLIAGYVLKNDFSSINLLFSGILVVLATTLPQVVHELSEINEQLSGRAKEFNKLLKSVKDDE